MKVKVLGISGSPRHGNTDILVKESLKGAEELREVETEFISVKDKKIRGGCISTYRCFRDPSWTAPCRDYKNDDVNEILLKMVEADGIIVGVPVYWGGLTAQLKNVIDRSMSLEPLGFPLRNKVGGAIAVAYDRQGGLEGAIAELQRWFLTHDMIIVSVGPERPKESIGCYYGVAALQGWPTPVSTRVDPKGSLSAVKQDIVGMTAARFLGKRVAEMAKVIKAGFAQVKGETAWPSGSLKEKSKKEE